MNLNKKDIICITRVLQSILFKNDIGMFFACKYCEYRPKCIEMIKQKNTSKFHFNIIRKKLQTITGLDLNIIGSSDAEARCKKKLK
ncbi:hypothetical protein [Clostridium sp. MD294]|uniref:hypothetical protein n=1 Tax=Clostridium sp. MD294 TaxID=97138 RepID=UPI0002C8C3EE|nr:hypothetical protein [Clostridium sp. MD294]NDO45852.1 hypothetical protein [Clostridium sp. MD294]USF30492.1 hypothetical protein C820_001933 [Clostridium sp. MD294]